MSNYQQGPNWWLASDGKWYPPESFGGTLPPPPPQPARERLSWGLSGTLMGFQIAMALCALGSFIAACIALVEFEGLASGRSTSLSDLDSWTAAFDAANGFYGFFIIFGIVVFVLNIIWTNKSYKAVPNIGPRKWGSGWTVGAWFIPLANNLLVPMVMSETARLSCSNGGSAATGVQSSRKLQVALVLWWCTYAVSGVLWTVGLGNVDTAETQEAARVFHWLAVVGGFTSAFSLVCAAIFVFLQTRRLQQ